MEKTKEQRLADINELIKVIGSKDRKFLSSHSDNYDLTRALEYAYFVFKKDGKLYYIDDYSKKPIAMQKRCISDVGFSHGGTLFGLIRDFAYFILTGNYANHKHGYGGLYCPHWGYSEQSMQEIRDFAVSIGYLDGDYKTDREYGKMANDGFEFKAERVEFGILPLETKSEEGKQEALLR